MVLVVLVTEGYVLKACVCIGIVSRNASADGVSNNLSHASCSCSPPSPGPGFPSFSSSHVDIIVMMYILTS